ncbi:unnamed protein product [Acanthoscelides obtectus]|uniref:Uncharacterized protein n=1 Tax=Acanthoscelides obtectus TaxID=200917 RepID=A0A9P0JRG5_ACAOB|nr:unnamed protein product [Acanthoscelides obtectus]CAK1668106.1 hypothetical protein AOBTE_LOCUS26228 [Acanthoscelides obtectus]
MGSLWFTDNFQLARVSQVWLFVLLVAVTVKFNLLSDVRHGFRQNRSVETATSDFLNDVYSQFDQGNHVVSMMFDLPNTFDILNKNIISENVESDRVCKTEAAARATYDSLLPPGFCIRCMGMLFLSTTTEDPSLDCVSREVLEMGMYVFDYIIPFLYSISMVFIRWLYLDVIVSIWQISWH